MLKSLYCLVVVDIRLLGPDQCVRVRGEVYTAYTSQIKTEEDTRKRANLGVVVLCTWVFGLA